MRGKKISAIGIIVIIILIFTTGITAYKLIGPGSKDLRSAKEFMDKLYSIKAVDTSQNLKDIKYERVKKLNSQNDLVHKSILTQTFGIDLDKDNNIIGFAKKDVVINSVNINIDEAQIKAEEYLNAIYDEEITLKSIVDENESLPYYTFIFTKSKDGYSFYFDEIKININKETGFLDGYSNSAMQRSYKEPKINIDKSEAEEIALDTFKKYNDDGTIKIEENYPLVYLNNKIDKNASTEEELCYMIEVDGKGINGSDIMWKVFVNSESGEVFNVLKDGSEKDVTVNN